MSKVYMTNENLTLYPLKFVTPNLFNIFCVVIRS